MVETGVTTRALWGNEVRDGGAAMEASEAGNFITLNPAAPEPRQDQAVVCLTQVPSSCAALLTHQLVLPDRPAQGPRLALCRCAGALAWCARSLLAPTGQ